MLSKPVRPLTQFHPRHLLLLHCGSLGRKRGRASDDLVNVIHRDGESAGLNHSRVYLTDDRYPFLRIYAWFFDCQCRSHQVLTGKSFFSFSNQVTSYTNVELLEVGSNGPTITVSISGFWPDHIYNFSPGLKASSTRSSPAALSLTSVKQPTRNAFSTQWNSTTYILSRHNLIFRISTTISSCRACIISSVNVASSPS